MCTRSARQHLLSLALLVLIAAGCATGGPRATGGQAGVAPTWNQGFGGAARVYCESKRLRQVVKGELIAIGDDSLLVLTPTALEAIALESVTRVVLAMEINATGRQTLYFDPGEWSGMRVYARFPQGLPEGLDPGTLKPGPGTTRR